MRILLTSLTAVLMLSSATVVYAADQTTLTPDKIALLKTTCVSAQVTLQQIQYNDAANRVNRGQGYESLLSSLMIPLNSRTSADNFTSSATELSGITARYEQSLNNFKSDYDRYDDALTKTLHEKCVQNPEDFYKNLTETREQRTDVSNDVTTLGQLTSEYQQAVIKLKSEVH
jgi:hypothetical protein